MIQRVILNLICIAVTALIPWAASHAQNINTAFGQNRQQFERYKWFRYESPNFIFSFTQDNEGMASFVVPIAEESYHELKAVLEYQVKKRIEVIIYSDFSDYNQSNIGEITPALSPSGFTRVSDNKILLYFDGNHQNLHRQIREGVARVLVNRMLFGSNLQEVFQNSVLMHLPKWFTEGMVAYAGEEWSTERDNELRELMLSGKYRNFLELANEHPRLAGQSLFHFIARQYSNTHVSNLLYLTRINRSVESGFMYVFGASFYSIAGANWFNYYSERYNSDNQNRRFPNKGELTLIKNRHLNINDVKLSPDGEKIAYVERIYGAYRVVVHDIEKDERKVIKRGGLHNHIHDFEPNYPLLGWSKNSEQLLVINERADKIFLQQFGNTGGAKGKAVRIKGVERVNSFDVADGNSIVFSGILNGRSDLYFCDFAGGEARPINQDKFDDLYPAIVKWEGKRGIVFSSNRPKPSFFLQVGDTLQPNDPLDLYFYNLENKTLTRLTQTPFANEVSPTAMGEQIAYLSDNNGIFNRYLVQMDSVTVRYDRWLRFADGSTAVIPKDSILPETVQVDSFAPYPVVEIQPVSSANTDYSRSIQEHHGSRSKITDLIYREGAYHLFVREQQTDRSMKIEPTNYQKLITGDGAVSAADNNKKTEEKTAKNTTKTQPQPSNTTTAETDKIIARELKMVEEEMKNDTTPPSPDTAKIDIDNYLFQSEFEDVKKPTVTQVNPDTVVPAPLVLVEGSDGTIETTQSKPRKKTPTRFDFNRSKYKPFYFDSGDKKTYKSIFKVEELSFELSNEPLFGQMEMYLGGNYRFPPVGLMFKTSLIDVFENFRIEIGARLPTSFNGMEYFINVENRKSLIDQTYSIYRRSRLDDVYLVDTASGYNVLVKARNVKHIVQADLRYPINRFQSIRAIPSLQTDKLAVVAQDIPSLSVPVISKSRLGLRFEYVFDNTIDLRVNAQKGTAFKAYLDFYKEFSVETEGKFKVNFGDGYTGAIGVDLRHYLALDNKAVLALRFAGATSFGTQKMLYSLGGMEGWMLPRYDRNTALPSNSDGFAYQVLAGNMRGFRNNIRNGSSFALINAELRVPILEYILRNPSRNLFLRNLQLTSFFDVGTAWLGSNPFDPNNPLNSVIIDPNSNPNTFSPIWIKVNYFRRPIVMGFGFGLRSVILGYYVRLDYAWGVETGKLQTPMLYLSLGTDF